MKKLPIFLLTFSLVILGSIIFIYTSHKPRERKNPTSDVVSFKHTASRAAVTVSSSSLLKGEKIYINELTPEICILTEADISDLDMIVKVDGKEVISEYDKAKQAIVCKLSNGLKDGKHQVVVEEISKIKDEGEKTEEEGIEGSITFAFSGDTVFPSITNIQPERENIISETRPAISCGYTDEGSGIDEISVKLIVDAEDVSPLASITSSGLKYIPNKDLADGEHEIIIEVKDNTGNLAKIDYEFTIRNYVLELEDGVSEGDWDKICESADKIMKEGGRLVDELIEAAKDETKDIVLRSMYLEILGEIEDSKAVDSLINIVKDDSEDSEIRANAAYSLGKIGDSRAIEPLLEELDNEDTNIRSTISLALGLLNASEAIAPLLGQLNNSKDLTERIRAGSSLASMKAQQAYDSFISILTSDEAESIRLLSALWLGELEDIRAVSSLITALEDKNSYVACNAAIALGALKDISAVQPLMEALEEEGLLRVEAAEALAEIGDQSAAQAIAAAIEIEKDTWGLKKLKEAYKKLTGEEYEE